MAHPDAYGIVNGRVHLYPLPDSFFFYYSPVTYLKNRAEVILFHDWLKLPHYPEINITSYKKYLRSVGHSQHRLDPGVATMITAEQERRFRVVAEHFDISVAIRILAGFRAKMEEIREMLEVRRDDELADFNPEDFERLEKEDRK